MNEASRIERFAALLEETGPGRHHRRPQDAEPDLLALVGLTHGLERTALPTVGPAVRAELHERILAALRREGPGRDTVTEVLPTIAVFPPRPRRGADDLVATMPPRPVPAIDEKTQVVRAVRPRLGNRARLAALVGLAIGAVAISGISMARSDAGTGEPPASVNSCPTPTVSQRGPADAC